MGLSNLDKRERAVKTLIEVGFTRESVDAAMKAQNLKLLVHSGLYHHEVPSR
jgi:hypothetical protein